jgi:perosamine synthetase
MWVRKRLDFAWSDAACAIANSLLPRNRAALAARLERNWSPDDEAIACLSVRSGFDLWLSAVNLPPGSEILVSAITIHDMLRIIEEHGLVAVPVDIDADHLAVDPASCERALTSRTRAILVAHLFGTRQPLEGIVEFARRHGLLLIEDSAQAFAGAGYTGHPDADVSMFSFGPIKTATALGGGLMQIRDPQACSRVRELLAAQPVQGRGAYLGRVLKYAAMKFFSPPLRYALVIRVWRMLGYDPDRMVNGAVRGFAGPDFFRRIRRQPSAALLALVRRQIARFRPEQLTLRTRRGERLMEQLGDAVTSPGWASAEHSFWVFPVLVDDSDRLIEALRRAGFDGSSAHSLCVVPPPPDRPALQAVMAQSMLPRIVYLPCYAALPERELDRMAAVVRAVEGATEAMAQEAPQAALGTAPALSPGGHGH